ncbi:asparaginase [Planctomonas psychrotolerans]|uniref:asparaginase n=1 Tax=Planctomonas psychrotolerans TaxID=2528712 RepID=UPI00123A16A4|nr:asparaginase [Planctomonas psychrotolerans]
MTATITLTNAVELATVERSGFVESRHAGAAVVLAPDGTVLRALGDVSAPVFPRSCMKPFQALAILASGVDLSPEEITIASGSHSGTAPHVSLVRGMLARAGLPVEALGCPADWPLDRNARDELVRSGGRASPVYMNCSGKHAAMLLACVQNGWDTDSYLDPQHPLQERIRDVLQRFTGERIAASGVDGCGAPVHAISLTALARGIAKISTSPANSSFDIFRRAASLSAAIRANGWAIDGPGRANTLVVDQVGLLAKGGAEGVMVMAQPDGTSVALKMLDGSLRAASIVALELLAAVGSVPAEQVERIRPALDLAVLGGGVPVGAIRASAAVTG